MRCPRRCPWCSRSASRWARPAPARAPCFNVAVSWATWSSAGRCSGATDADVTAPARPSARSMAGVLRHQLQVAESGDQSDGERDDKRQPHHAAYLLGHLARERVNASSKDVADDEQQQ